MEKNDWQLAFVRADGTVCPLVGGQVEARHLTGLINAVFGVKRYMQGVELVVNQHIVTGLIVDRESIKIQGVAVHYEQAT